MPRLIAFALVVLALITIGCGRPPVLEFTAVPAGGEGNPIQLNPIEGRVTGATPGQRIVLYARSGVWWVQPLADKPFTEVRNDSTWRATTHPGTEYAALLVDPGYVPQAKLTALPVPGGAVRAVVSQKAKTAAPAIIHFSGYDWEVRHQPSERGGTLNPYDPANVWLDSTGALHLRTTRQRDAWAGAEVQLTHSLGHGSYRFTVRDISHLDPATALTLYTRDESAADQNNREIDIEISRWGEPAAAKNAQYVVPPFNEPANVVRFTAPAGPLTYSFVWEPGRVFFRTMRDAAAISQHEFTSNVPAPGGESARMNLYVYGRARTPAKSPSEVVVDKFEYLP